MLNLITDRTSSDVTRAKTLLDKVKNNGIESLTTSELAEYIAGLKGCYSIPDLLRVENAVKYISDLLNTYGYANTVNVKLDWKDGDLFTPTQQTRYLNNLNILKNAYYTLTNTPSTPNTFNPYNKANDIEQILVDIEAIIINMTQNFIHCGVANCGQSRLWQQRFRRTKDYTSTYPIDKYLSTDTVRLLITSNTTHTGKYTSTLALPQVDIFDDVGGSITAFNTAFTYLDSLIGGVV